MNQEIYTPNYLNSHAILIGINNYQNSPPLDYAINDAKATSQILIDEFNFNKDAHILISIATRKSEPIKLEKSFEIEQERRLSYNRPSENSSEVIRYLFRQLDKFKRVSEDEISYFVTDLMEKIFNLSIYCLLTLRLLRSKIKKNIADEYFKGLKSTFGTTGLYRKFLI